MGRFVALLRGINVGGKNLIKMTELKACFEDQGFTAVATYIQSGNVVFAASAASPAKLVRRVEDALADRFRGYPASVVIVSASQLQAIVERAPKGFGQKPAQYRYDVIFLKQPLTAAVAMKSVVTRDGVDQAHAGTGVLYFSRLISRASQSRLSRVVSLPVYQDMTIRNWNTTTKLLRMVSSEGE